MRCNVGVNPKYLLDQHLLAELMEIPMVIGSLKYWGCEIKSSTPTHFKLGSGHMNFLKFRLLYLNQRFNEVKKEINRRGFRNIKSCIDFSDIPQKYLNSWRPDLNDSMIIRNRICNKIRKKDLGFWRYNRKRIVDRCELEMIIIKIRGGDLFYV